MKSCSEAILVPVQKSIGRDQRTTRIPPKIATYIIISITTGTQPVRGRYPSTGQYSAPSTDLPRPQLKPFVLPPLELPLVAAHHHPHHQARLQDAAQPPGRPVSAQRGLQGAAQRHAPSPAARLREELMPALRSQCERTHSAEPCENRALLHRLHCVSTC
eukprot:SAG31_NODE_8858_length_1373_cov_65.514129_1_plen_160_part_00